MSDLVAKTVLRCVNSLCRIETYVGAMVPPLSACPVCQGVGIAQMQVRTTATTTTNEEVEA